MGLPPWARRFFETSGATWALLMDPGEAPPLPELPHIKWILRFYADEAVEKAEVEQGTAGAWPHYKRLKPFLDARPWLREWRFWVTSNNEMTNAETQASGSAATRLGLVIQNRSTLSSFSCMGCPP